MKKKLDDILKLIKEGIQSGDLDKVSDGYFHITGERVKPPKQLTVMDELANLVDSNTGKKRGRPKKKQTTKVEDIQDEEVVENLTDIPIVEKPSKKNRRNGEPVKAGRTTFIDVPNLFPQDKEFDAKSFNTMSPRRKPVTLIDVVCRKCKKAYKVPPSYLTQSIEPEKGEENMYVCNSCCTKGDS